MNMYNVIEAIEKRLTELKDEIYFKDLQINDLKVKLSEAEKEAADLKQTISEYVETLKKGANE